MGFFKGSLNSTAGKDLKFFFGFLKFLKVICEVFVGKLAEYKNLYGLRIFGT